MPDGRLRRSNAWTLDGSETSAAPVSPDGCIRLRSNAGGTAIEVSYDQAAYVTLSGGGTSDGTGTELQRTDGSGGFVKVTGSSVSGGDVTLFGNLTATSDTLTQVLVKSAAEQPAYISFESSANTAASPQGLTGTNQLIANVKFKLYNTSNALKEVASLAALMDGSNATNPAGELVIYLRASGAAVLQSYYDFRTTAFTVTPNASFLGNATITAGVYLNNATSLNGINAAASTSYQMIGMSASDTIWLDTTGRTMFAGTATTQITNSAGKLLIAALDRNVRLDEIGDPTASKTFTMSAGGTDYTLRYLWDTVTTVDFLTLEEGTPGTTSSGAFIKIKSFGSKNALVINNGADQFTLGGGGSIDTNGVITIRDSVGLRMFDGATNNVYFQYVGATPALRLIFNGGAAVSVVTAADIIPLAKGGTGAALVDPNADRIMFWDDSAGAVTWLTLGTNLTITGTTLDASGSGSGANAALSNLASVSINASLIPQTTLDLGANTTAWRNLYLYGAGTYGSHSFKLHGTPTAHRVLTLPDVTDTVAVLGINNQTFTGSQIFGSTITHTTANTATSSAQSFFDQNITIAPGGSSSAAYRMFDLSVLFTTAQTLSGSVILYNSSVTHSQNSSLAGYYVHFDTFTKDTANSVSAVTGYDWVASISSGTTSDLYGYIADFTVGASGTATTTIGFTSTLVNAGSASTYYAFRAIKSGTITNPYGFGSSAGFLHGFGTLTPTVTMDVVGGALFTLDTGQTFIVTSNTVSTGIRTDAWGTSIEPAWQVVRGRGTRASPTAVQNTDSLGQFTFVGQYDSTVGHITTSATIRAEAQANFTATNDAPTDLLFSTKYNSLGVHSGIRLTSQQLVGVGYDMAHSDVGARFHVLETDTAVVATIIRTAASSTADCLRLMASSTVKVKFTTNSSGDMNSVFGSAALATNATDGFIFAPTCAGAATGTPSTYTGTAPVVVDTTNFRLYCNFSGSGWKMLQFI